jgi:predicted outer membrane repeat protein
MLRTRNTRRTRLWVQALENRTVPNTYSVTNTSDGSPAPAGSLRAAINSANSHPGTDSITFDPVVFGSAKVIDLTGHGQLSVTGPVTITGPGSKLLTVKTSGAASVTNRVLAISGGGAVTISGMTLTGGDVSGSGGGVKFGSESVTLSDVVVTGNWANVAGGGISFSSGTLTMTNCSVTSNTSADNFGGGVYFSSGKMNASNVTISSNAAGGYAGVGGGVYLVGGKLTMVDSTVSDNTSFNAAGGIYCGSSGSMAIDRSTISGNQSGVRPLGYYFSAPAGGGGIYSRGVGTITNCTISGNQAKSFGVGGGGIQVYSGSLTIRNSTIAYNGPGGGIVRVPGGSVDLESTIVSDNQGGDVSGPVTANFSLISNPTGATVTGANNVYASAMLAPLADNGGPTRTHALLPGSPAINAGSNPAGLTTDQRGPGFPRSVGGGVDIGAVDPDLTIPRASASAPAILAVTAAAETITVTYSVDSGVVKATSFDDGDITVTGPGGYSKAGHLVGGPYADAASVIVQYTVPPNDSGVAGQWDWADNGTYTISMNTNQVQSASGKYAPAGQISSYQVGIGRAFLVDEATDINDGNTAAGRLSLREAIGLANLDSTVSDTINFSPSVFASQKTIGVGTAMTVADPVMINGPAAGLVLDAGGSGQRIFTIDVPGYHSAVSISNMTLRNGTATQGSIIRTNDDDLTLTKVSVISGQTSSAINLGYYGGLVATDCVLSGNHGGGGDVGTGGAAIFAGIGSYSYNLISLTRCTISGNGAPTGDGGAIRLIGGSFTATSSTFTNNVAAGSGGAIASGASIEMVNSTLSGNTAAGDGGAIYGGSIEIVNSTLSGNSAGGNGGAVAAPRQTVSNSTITGNTAAGNGGGIAGGNFIVVGGITLNSTIVAGNAASNGPDLWSKVSADTTGGDYNLVGVATANPAIGGSHNKTGTAAAPLNPMLAPLANNGGSTQTRALLPGSPAINAGSNVAGLTTDQRGYQRVAGGQADIGAYESGAAPVAPPTVTSVSINDGSAQRSRVTSLTLTFSTQVTFAGAVTNAFTLTRNGGGSVAFTATSSMVGGVTVVTLNAFTGSEAEYGSLRDGRYTLTAIASQISAGSQALDGNSDGTAGDDYVLIGDPATNKLFRLFGDSDGDGAVSANDFVDFRQAFNGVNNIFDFDGDGFVSASDFIKFRSNYGQSI